MQIDYNNYSNSLNALLNKKVLSLILKTSKLEVDLIVVGSRFQSLGATQLNDLSARVFLCKWCFCSSLKQALQ